MKYSLRKSFNYRRRRKEVRTDDDDDDHPYPLIDATTSSTSSSNLVKLPKSRRFLRRRSSSPVTSLPTGSSSDRIKSEVFEPRTDVSSNGAIDEEPDPFARVRPLDRLTNQIRQSFRNTLTRRRSRLESTASTKRLISNQPNDHPVLPLAIATGLTSPLTLPKQSNLIEGSSQRRKAPVAPPNNDHEQQSSKTTNRSFRERFSFFLKKQEEAHPKPTFAQRFDTLKRSFRFGHRNSSTKNARHLLGNE